MKNIFKLIFSVFLVFGSIASASLPISSVNASVTDPTPQELANFAFNNVGSHGYSKSALSRNLVDQAAFLFLKPGFTIKTEGNSTHWKSKDGLRRVRFGPKSTVAYQANFERFSVANTFENNNRTSNYHVNMINQQ